MPELPSGTVTFLFTDVEDSTPIWEQFPSAMRQAMERHDELIDSLAKKHNGFLVRPRGEGDSRFVVFEHAIDAVNTGLAIQQGLHAESWPTPNPIRVRMGIHTGKGEYRDGDYYGSDVVRCARLRGIAYGGQTLLSQRTRDLVRNEISAETHLLDLGEHRLKGLKQPEHVFQLLGSGLTDQFPPLKSLADISIPEAQLPAFLDPEQEEPEQPIFVERRAELARLGDFMDEAMAYRGGVALVTGDAGRGKTALLNEYSRLAIEAYPDLMVTVGNCNAFAGTSDPYLPFREILCMLTGDVEARWKAGRITTRHANQMWSALPEVVQVLLDSAPHLLNRFLRGVDLIARAQLATDVDTPWLNELIEIVHQQQYISHGIEPSYLFEQYANLLLDLSDRYPLLLILDDVQWMDAASMGLLFYLGRHLAGKRILIVCAYRPEEIIPYRDGTRHPLEKIINEFKRQRGDISVDLNRVEEPEGRRFVDAFLETELNNLGESFRASLSRHTDGHPLFTIELLRSMQERGDLVRDAQGRWIEGDKLDWQYLPTRVEAVIEERIGRLDDSSVEILKAACVEGEEFTAQVVAKVQEISERQLLSSLSQELEKRHDLVREVGDVQVGDQLISRFTFTHSLFQNFLYNTLSARERQILHGEIADTLEQIYLDHSGEIAVLLSKHFLEAAKPDQAKNYLLYAGHQARTLYAHVDAENYYQQAITIMQASGQDKLVAETKHAMGLVHLVAGEYDKAAEIFSVDSSHWQHIGYEKELGRSLPSAVMKIAIEQPTTLDPGLVNDDVSAFMSAQLFEGLVRVGKDHNVLPAAASRWQIAAEGRRYTFYLREGHPWSDGSPQTASDFEYAWERNLDPATRSPAAHLLYPIHNARAFGEGKIDDPGQVGVTALDDLTLEVELESPTAYFPYLLTQSVSYPLPKWAVEVDNQPWTEIGRLVCNGAYDLVDWDEGKSFTLSKNPFYMDDHFPGNVERVECLAINDYEKAMDLYADNEVVVMTMFNADPGTIANARAVFKDELVPIPQPSTYYLIFLVDRPPFDDAHVRKAFVHAVDREALVQEAFQGLRQAATGGFVPPGMPGHSNKIGLEYAPAHANRLLSLAGFPEGKGFPEVTWIHAAGSDNERVVPFLQKSWKRNIGIRIHPKSLAWGDLNDRLEKDPAHLTLIAWSAGYRDPDNFLRVVFHCKEGLNDPRWCCDRFDALVEDAIRITDHDTRMTHYHEADEILIAEETVIMPLSYGQGRVLVKSSVSIPQPIPANIELKNLRLQNS